MTERDAEVLIVGAGLGGLTTAALLLEQRRSVRVFEQSAALGEIGAGIQISANAAHVLEALGLGDELDRAAVLPERFEFRLYDSGELLHELPLGQAHARQYGAKYYHLHRADLHRLLAARVAALDPQAVKLGAQAVGCTETATGVTVRFTDGSAATGELLIAADGIRSTLRNQIVGDVTAEFTGYTAWRGMIPADRLPSRTGPPVCAVWSGPVSHAVTYYVRAGQLVNFVGIVSSDSWREESWTVKDAWPKLKADFAGFHADLQQLIDALPADECYRWALYDRPPTRGWGTQRATVLGDAAHATLPFMAQGACMAIEDAAILARALDGDCVETALALFELNRYERTSRVQRGSRDQGRLYRFRSPDELRSGFASAGLSRASDEWLYAYNPLTVPLERPAEELQ